MNSSRFEKIVSEHKDRIYSHALYFLRDRRDAEDVTQEVLIRAWQNLESIRQRTTKAWLMRVTHNLCIDYARQRKASGNVIRSDDISILEKRTASSLSESNPEHVVENAERLQQILSALQKLPDTIRSVVMLREIQDMKYEDISHTLDIPLNTVKVYIHRGRKELQSSLRQSITEEIG
jgi:RNA polymerase sigma factor (sigma-70 family)